MFGNIYLTKIKSIFNSATWIFSFFAIILTGVVAVSQNSIPGDATYPIKTGFEKVVLAAYRIFHKDTDYQINLTELRFKESKKLIKSDKASAGLNNLYLQIIDTENSIKNLEDSNAKSTYANLYISTLKEINTQLETEKNLNTNQAPNIQAGIPLSTANPGQTPPEINNQINQTQQQIEETIENLSQDSANTPEAAPTAVLEQPVNPTPIPSEIPQPTQKKEHEKQKEDKEKKEDDH